MLLSSQISAVNTHPADAMHGASCKLTTGMRTIPFCWALYTPSNTRTGLSSKTVSSTMTVICGRSSRLGRKFTTDTDSGARILVAWTDKRTGRGRLPTATVFKRTAGPWELRSGPLTLRVQTFLRSKSAFALCLKESCATYDSTESGLSAKNSREWCTLPFAKLSSALHKSLKVGVQTFTALL